MRITQLEEIVDRATRSAFRLETLPQYLVPQEAERFTAWRDRRPLPPREPGSRLWQQRIRESTERGFRWYRVHIMDNPLSEYARFELASYVESQHFGQETHLVDREDHAELADLHEDFWLVDDEIAVRMVYDPDGRFERPEAVDDPAPYREIRDLALRWAEPLDSYLARRGITVR